MDVANEDSFRNASLSILRHIPSDLATSCRVTDVDRIPQIQGGDKLGHVSRIGIHVMPFVRLRGTPVSSAVMVVARGATDKDKGKTASRPLARRTGIGIVLYPGAKLAAVHGLTDLFETANQFSARFGGESPATLQISHWAARADTAQIDCVFESEPRQTLKPDCLIFPPTLEIDAKTASTDALLAWARAQHASGTTLCSVCGGAFLLAQMGLLNGRTATTHWSYSDVLATRFPEIQVKSDELIIDLVDVITAGGVMAWLDLGLKLVDRYLGPLVMMRTAQFFLVNPGWTPAALLCEFLTTDASWRRSSPESADLAAEDCLSTDHHRNDG